MVTFRGVEKVHDEAVAAPVQAENSEQAAPDAGAETNGPTPEEEAEAEAKVALSMQALRDCMCTIGIGIGQHNQPETASGPAYDDWAAVLGQHN